MKTSLLILTAILIFATLPARADVKLPAIGDRSSPSYEGEGYIIVRHPETAVVEQALARIVQTVRVELG